VGNVYTDADGQTFLNVKTQLTSFGGIDGVLLLTCDMPSVGSAHIQLLMNEFLNASPHVASWYDDSVGVPTIFPAADFGALQSLEGDTGAKSILRKRNPSLIALEGGTFDLDTPEDVMKWRASIWK
ncbi:MAG: NTP transferase domain-containing protein, partial [Gemmatimonas sp.]